MQTLKIFKYINNFCILSGNFAIQYQKQRCIPLSPIVIP